MRPVACVIATVHCAAAPEHAPLQPKKVEPSVGMAVRVTVVPSVTACEQAAAGQLMPAGLLVTVPLPVPPSETVSVWVPGGDEGRVLNVAVTFRACVIETVHCVEAPEHAPPQPANDEPPPGLAVSVT